MVVDQQAPGLRIAWAKAVVLKWVAFILAGSAGTLLTTRNPHRALPDGRASEQPLGTRSPS
jgi:hypothetical protein